MLMLRTSNCKNFKSVCTSFYKSVYRRTCIPKNHSSGAVFELYIFITELVEIAVEMVVSFK